MLPFCLADRKQRAPFSLWQRGAFFCLAVMLMVLPAAAQAEKPATALDEVISGFDEGTALSEQDRRLAQGPADDSRWDLQGAFTLSSAYNINHDSPPPGQTDHRGLSRLRAELDLQLEADLYKSWRLHISGRGFYDGVYELQGRSDYTRRLLAEYEDEVEFRETYLAGSPWPAWDVKLGRQIMVWGNTENFRVTDILNPVDNRTPGLVDIEDLRLPVCMGRVDYYWGDYSLMAAVIPELRFNKNPVYGSDYYAASQPQPRRERLANEADNAELALAWRGILPGWDFALYAARHYQNDSYYKTVGQQQVGLIEVVPGVFQPVYAPVYERRYAQLYMAGAEVNVARGDWLLKTELAYNDGYKFNRTDDEKGRLDGLLGVEYTGWTDISLTLEVVGSHYFDFERTLRQFPDYAEETRYQAAFRYSQDLLYDRLELTFLALLMEVEGDDTFIERFSAAYDITDQIALNGGVVFYQGGDQPGYEDIHKNNRIFLDIKYQF